MATSIDSLEKKDSISDENDQPVWRGSYTLVLTNLVVLIILFYIFTNIFD